MNKRIMKLSSVKVLSAGIILLAAITATTPQTVGASCTAPPAGLVSWWPGEGNANDVVGGNNGAAQNIIYAGGEVGSAFYLNGSNAYVKVPASASLNVGTGNGFTFEAWINPTSVQNPQALAEWNNNAGDAGIGAHLFITESQYPTLGAAPSGCIYANLIDTSGGSHVFSTGGGVVVSNSYQHIALTYDKASGMAVLYQNGVAVQTSNLGTFTPQTSYDFYLGMRAAGTDAGSYFGGGMDEPGLYNRALSSSEIQAIYNAGSAGKCAPASAACTPPPTGLVGWWKGDGNPLDSFGGNNGVNQNVTYTNGVVGQAFAFDPENYSYGTYTGIQIADRPAYALTNSLTIEGWVRPRGNGYIIFWRGDNRPGLDPYVIAMQDNNTVLFQISDANGNGANVGTTLAYNQWCHLAATLDGNSGTMSIYTNGMLASQTSTTIRPFGQLISGDSPGIGIGNLNDGQNNFPFIGDIDEISLYSRALAAGEIQAIYNAGSAGKCTSEPLLANVDFGSGAARGYSLKNGFAAIGMATNDFWNFYDRDASTTSGDWRYSGTLTNLQAANGVSTTVGMSVSDAPGAWNDASSDPMYKTYDYPLDGGNNVVAFTNLPAGQYDVLAYSMDGNYEVTAGGTSYGVKTTYDSPVSSVPVWTEGVQYARWRNVPVGAGQNLVLTVRNGVGGYAILSGVQIVSSAYLSETPSGVPAISNFSPMSGAAGSTVTISGTNFSASASADIVYFGAVRANVLTASPNSLTVTVPAGATFAPITVTVNGLTAYAEQPFTPTFAGTGQFNNSSLAPFVNLPTPNGPGQVVIADLDGDGKPDLIIPDSYAGGISIYQNISTNGSLTAGSFGPQIDLPLLAGSNYNPYKLVVADLDGDGRPDIIALNADSKVISILKNISSPGVLTTNSFATRIDLPGGNIMRGLAVQDLNGDGLPEIVTANQGDNSVSIFQNLSTVENIAFASRIDFSAGNGACGVEIGDLDGDGLPDLVVANITDGTISVFRNQVAGGNITTNSFAPQMVFPATTSAFQIAIGDLDGDGKLDLVVGGGNGSQAILVYRNTSTVGSITGGSFAAPVTFAAPGWVNSIALADLDGDGKLDIALVSQLSSVFSIFKNVSASGSFTTASLAARVDYPAGWNPNGMAVGDLDGDGRPDVVFANTYDNTVSLYQNVIAFGTAPANITQPTNQTAAVGDTATFNVTAGGAAPLSYQWNFNGTNIAGATNATLILTNVQLTQAGNYAVLVTNIYGAAASSNAVLSVFVPAIPPAILSQTPNQVVLLGNTATFSVNVSGSDPLSYFWSRNGVLIPGATNASYAFYNAQLADSGSKFSCVVTNAYGSASSTNVSLKVIDTMANDLCSGAIVINTGSYTNVQSTLKASSYGDPVPDCVSGFGHGVWYQFTAPVTGQLIVDTFGSDFDTGLAIYTGSCDSLTQVQCSDDVIGVGVTSQVTMPTTAGTTYIILAGGYGSDSGNLVLHLNHLTPPAFVMQPTNTSVVVSSNASFTATLAGTLPMSLQWYFNDAPLADGGRISGSTNSTLNIANVQTNDGGNYFLIASNVVGVTTSSVVVLTPVILPPVFVQTPASQAVGVGSNANFAAVVSGTSPFSYQWDRNGYILVDDGIHITGSTTSSLSISNLSTADAGNYTLTVTNQSGSASAMAVLVVMTPPAFTSQPVGRSVPPGLPTTFNASASGIPAPYYQWQLNGTNISSWSPAGSFSIGAVNTNDLGAYQVIAQNSMGSATSTVAQLTFGPVAAWGLNLSGECLPPPGLSNVMAVAGTYGASYAVKADGSVVAWGSGPTKNVPSSATNVVALSASGAGGIYALRSDGSVVGWYAAYAQAWSNLVSVAAADFYVYGLRSEGTLVSAGNAPVFPAGLSQITAIACGYANAVALRSNGTVAVAGTGAVTNVPAGLANVVAVAVGNSFALALKSDGTVTAWGGSAATNLPSGLTNIAAISAGNYAKQNYALAIRSNGTVVVWGESSNGETNPPSALTNLVSIAGAAAPYHSLALINDGSPVILYPPVGLTAYTGRSVTLQGSAVGAQPLSYQWLLNGTNIPGATSTSLVISNVQFGNAGNYQLFVSNSVNTALSLPAPLTVISNNTLTFLSGPASQTNYQGSKITLSATVLGSGPLKYQWYYSPTVYGQISTPVSGATNKTLNLDPALAAQTGYYYLAVSNNAVRVNSSQFYVRVLFAKAWGYLPTDPPFDVTNATAIAVGNAGLGSPLGAYLALKSNGKISSWSGGFATYGETNFTSLSNVIVTAVAAGYQDSLVLKSDGTVAAFGFNIYGETSVPAGLSGVTAIACGDYHDLALKSDGTIVGWGQNIYGQATNVVYSSGDGYVPVTNVVAVAAGGQNSIALRADGSVVTWGSYGTQLPYTVNISNNVAVAAGAQHFLALRANGTVFQWGGLANYPVPAGLSNIVAISAAANHSTALRADGSVVTWGYYAIGNAAAPADLANVIAIAGGGDHDLALFGTRAPSFTVQPWDRAFPVTATTNLTLAAKCAGVQPVYYQWQLNGINVPGATNDTLLLVNQPGATRAQNLIPTGAYQLIASNAYGVAASKFAKITTFIPLGTALNATNLNWITSGYAQWFGETNITHNGVSAAQSGGIGSLQQTILQTTVATNWSGRYTFWWKVSSEQDFDILEFRVNGIVQTSISGLVDWQQVSVPVAAGTNVLMWRYSKDASFDFGLDAGWVDQFSYVLDGPLITLQPVSQTVNMGTNVTFRVVANGPPNFPNVLRYQWWQNGNPVGGNSPVLTLNNVGRMQNGTYFVTVTNITLSGGSTVSSNAVLKVLVPQLLGTPALLPDGSFQFTSTDANGGLLSPSDLANFEAQVSTNLVNWATLPNALSLTNGMLLLQDNGSTNYAARYYRILEH